MDKLIINFDKHKLKYILVIYSIIPLKFLYKHKCIQRKGSCDEIDKIRFQGLFEPHPFQ